MKIKKTVKLQKQSKDGTISMTLPKIFANMYGYKPGDKIIIEADSDLENVLIIRKSS